MLSIEICKKILNTDKKKYTDEEIKQIREFLYQMVQIQIEFEEDNNEKN